MENSSDKFLSYDPLRHEDAQREYRLSEIKNKLTRCAETRLAAHLRKNKVEGVKIINAHVSSLEITEDVESGSPIYAGKVAIEATFLNEGQTKKATFEIDIVEGMPEIIEQSFQKGLDESQLLTTEATPEMVTVVKAMLNEFKLVDDGSKYLKVYHTAAYGDLEPIGAVAKNEYTASSDKASLLKAMLQDEAIAWPASVEFTGEFSEPAITAVEKEAMVYKVKEDASLFAEAKADTDLTHRYKSFDTFRFASEATQLNYNTLQNRIEQRALATLSDALKTRKSHFHIKRAETSYDAEKDSGKVIVYTELLDGKEMKVVPLEVVVEKGTMSLPTPEQVTSLLQNFVTVESTEVAPEVKSEAASPIEQTSSANAPINVGYQDILRISKDFLPSSLKIADVVEVDGLRYKLVSKSENQLDKNRDSALLWTFERVYDVPGENTPIYRVDY